MPEFISEDFVIKKLDEVISVVYNWKSDLGDEEILKKLLSLNLERGSRCGIRNPLDAFTDRII
jgi:hypothetical protein